MAIEVGVWWRGFDIALVHAISRGHAVVDFFVCVIVGLGSL